METKLKKVITFEKVKVTKVDWEDAECSSCGEAPWWVDDDSTRLGVRFVGGYAYVYSQDNWGGLQLCQKCFDKLDTEDEK